MKRKHLLFASLTSLAALTVVGCGGAGGGAGGGKVNVKVTCQYGKGPRGLLETFASEFNELQNKYNVVVDMEISGSYNDIFNNQKTALQDLASDEWGDFTVCLLSG